MNTYKVYAQHRYGPERIIGTYQTEEQAIAAIERYLKANPSAVCYINDGTVGWCR